jgi:hypothetical protein
MTSNGVVWEADGLVGVAPSGISILGLVVDAA